VNRVKRVERVKPLAALAAVATFAVLLLGCPPEKRACDPTTASSDATRAQRRCNPHSVILVRHAEKAPSDTKDPDLSPEGRARALRLATLLAKIDPARLVASEYKRTQQTLEPLAERLHLSVQVREAAHAKDLLRELRNAPPGSTTVVATHANVLPMMVRELGGEPLRDLDHEGVLAESDYGRVVVLSVGCSTTASVVVLSSDP
jgi:phosphohistidine phosphatase SixA